MDWARLALVSFLNLKLLDTLLIFCTGSSVCVYFMCVLSPGLDMSTFIRRYSRYLNEKAFAYRQMSFDFGRVKKGCSISFLIPTWPCCMINSALLLIFFPSFNMPEKYTYCIQVAGRIAHIPQSQGPCWRAGWAPSPPAWHWAKCMALLTCRDEYREGYYSCSQRGQLYLAGTHKVLLAR